MKAIDHYIATLLEDHDCVIVPDFGGFVANYAPAKINPINHRFDPPHRKLSFNRFLVHNDGLLASYVAQKEAESYAEALQQVKHYAVFLRESIKENKKVNIDKIGVLFQHQDGTYHFEQVRNPALFKQGTGLSSFFAQKLIHQKAVEKGPLYTATTAQKDEAKIIPLNIPPQAAEDQTEQDAAATAIGKGETAFAKEEKTAKTRVLWPVAAALIGLPILGYALWLTLTSPVVYNEAKRFELGDFNPFNSDSSIYKTREQSYQSGEWSKPEPIDWTAEEEHVLLELESTPDKTLVVKLLKKSETTDSTPSEALRYHIVGGCFSIKSNALNLVELYQSRGNNAALIDEKGGLFRVSVKSFSTKKEAKEYLTSVRNEIPGAWILYK